MKRMIACLLAAALAVSLILLPAAAAPAVSEDEMIQVVNALGIMVGDENGDMRLSAPVDRAQFTTMAVKAAPGGDRVGQATTSPYPDVPRTHWAAGYVAQGVKLGLISGYTDGTFRPAGQITLAEGMTIVLKLLGYGAADLTGGYPSAQMALGHSLGLDDGLGLTQSSVLTRRDAMKLFYNMLTAKTKTGQPYLVTVGGALTAAGQVDLVALINSKMDGPVVAQGNWKASFDFSLDKARVYLNGKQSNATAIRDYDVVYWSNAMKTLWVYNGRATGTIESLSPTAAAPTAVTVAGRSYSIATSAAAYALSDLGQYRVGDVVTLLLGRDDAVAGVTGPAAAASTDTVGVITAVNKGSYTGSGGSYTAATITLRSTDNKIYSYPYTTQYFSVGDLVRVTVKSDGALSITRLNEQKLTGKVSADGTKLAGHAFAAGAEILDIYGNDGLRTYPSRLAGVELTDKMVRYYALNAQGEITKLILKDVTGDGHSYGVITSFQDLSSPAGISTSSLYEVVVSGKETTISLGNVRYTTETGPCQIKGSLMSPDDIRNLTKVDVEQLDGNTARAGSRSYPLSDQVQIYEMKDGEYFLSNADRVQGKTLTGWYDKAPAAGGQIRVILAK